MRWSASALALMLVAGVSVLPLAQAQSIQSSVLGNVHDSAGAAVAGAKITLTNQGTNEELTQTTDDSGDYRFSGILVGSYTVSAEAPGFKGHVTRDVNVDISQIKRVDVALEIGQVTTKVTVEGGSAAQV